MKDFIKWLGVNEKVAKVVVWLMIIMLMLILTNTMLESTGFPNYKITYDNLVNIPINRIIDIILNLLITVSNFYTFSLLVFRTKEIKVISKYAILFLVLNIIITLILGSVAASVFIVLYSIVFAYLHSNKNKKYILYMVLSIIINTVVQGIWYTTKAKFVNYEALSMLTKSLLSIDYFIIMAVIILVKEIYLKKRGENKWEDGHQHAGSGSANSKTKTNSQRKSQKK